ncbi:dihydropteroate synthase [Desulforhabdus amnigena]|jgi:dihydropteroate synthase|uniref:Dihydropteroate synthase n=1 Tax=Desulforhabdus amnigena TaxID=40218 RepID=A0A9W6D238_9BACT|nr:dihydropteroate synthase [Desulforhabdus amnigena]NLJ27853.1 dihydropteroate synthase [Deltaproteobacteria bacterium]GLI33203.1 dihydropteroate synthase [Desulforhabdus amnigena]
MGVFPRKNYTIQTKSEPIELGEYTRVMGILNVTPDSFSDGGKYYNYHSAVQQALDMIVAGTDILDIGGESTRPNSDPVSPEVQLERVIPVIEAIRESSDIPISIDTTSAEVARQALDAGADIINDVSSLRFDEEMVRVAADTGVPLILMHMQGKPKTMQESPSYVSLFSEIIAFLEERIQFASRHGVDRSQIIVDPGIGFGKNITHNLLLIRNLELLQCLDRPILLAASRKRFIGSILGRSADDREVGTAVVHSFGIAAGAHIIRAHDVEIHKQVAIMSDAIREAL